VHGKAKSPQEETPDIGKLFFEVYLSFHFSIDEDDKSDQLPAIEDEHPSVNEPEKSTASKPTNNDTIYNLADLEDKPEKATGNGVVNQSADLMNLTSDNATVYSLETSPKEHEMSNSAGRFTMFEFE
jgi:hypothetical protein